MDAQQSPNPINKNKRRQVQPNQLDAIELRILPTFPMLHPGNVGRSYLLKRQTDESPDNIFWIFQDVLKQPMSPCLTELAAAGSVTETGSGQAVGLIRNPQLTTEADNERIEL